MTAFANRFLFILADTTIKATLLLAIAGLIAFLSRRASASFRHFVWMLGLGCSLCLPLLSLTLPSWHVSVKTSVQRPQPAPLSPTPVAPAPSDESQSAPIAPAPSVVSTSPTVPLPAAAPQTPVVSNAAQRPAMPWRVWALLLWTVGAAVALTRLGRGLWGLRLLRVTSARVLEGAFAEMLTAALHVLPTPRAVELRVAAPGRVSVPLTWGAWRPVIVLPAEAAAWPETRTCAALLHELAHVRRQDWLLQTVAQLTCAMYWFHPFVWLAARKMRAESERACDDLALSAGISPADYARHLLDVALGWRDGRRLGCGAVAMAQTPKIEGRLRAVLNAKLARRSITRRTASVALCAALLVALPLSALRTTTAQDGPKISASDSDGLVAASSPGQYKVDLPNHVTMELVGLSDQPWTEDHWWDGAGVPLAHAPHELGTVSTGLRFTVRMMPATKGHPASSYIQIQDPHHSPLGDNSWGANGYGDGAKGNVAQGRPNESVPYVIHETLDNGKGSSVLLFWDRPRKPAGSTPLTLVFHVTNPKHQDISLGVGFNGKSVGSVQYSLAHETSVSDDGDVFSSYVMLKRQASGQADMAMCLATGLWATSASAAVNKNTIVRGDRPNLTFGHRASFTFGSTKIYIDQAGGKTRNQPSLTILDTLGHVARRVVAVDRHGNLIPLPATDSDVSNTVHRSLISLPPGVRREAKEYRLQTRPYQTVEFRNIQLHPLTTGVSSAAVNPPLIGRQAHGFLKFVYLKDVATSIHPERPWSLMPEPDSHGGYLNEITETKTRYDKRLPDEKDIRETFGRMLALGWKPRPFTKLYLIPQSLSAWAPTRKVYFTTDQREDANTLVVEYKAWKNREAAQAQMIAESPVIATDADIEPRTTAYLVKTMPPEPVVDIHYTPQGAKKMAAFTAAHRGEIIGIFLDGRLLTAPVIDAPFSSEAELQGGFHTLADAQALAVRLNRASSQAPVTTGNQ